VEFSPSAAQLISRCSTESAMGIHTLDDQIFSSSVNWRIVLVLSIQFIILTFVRYQISKLQISDEKIQFGLLQIGQNLFKKKYNLVRYNFEN
jgi:hypothetical protein